MLRTSLWTVPGKHTWTLFQNSSRNSSQEQLIGKHHMETLKQLKDQFCRVFAAASYLSTRCPVDSTRVLVWYRFYFLRFLLICKLEGLDLSFTWKWFFFLKYFRTLSQNRSENRVQTVFQDKNCTNEFHVFILDFGLPFSDILDKYFVSRVVQGVLPWKQYWKIFPILFRK